MPHQIGFVEAGGGKLAHQKMLEVVATFAAANGWTVLRYDTTLTNHELILKAPGLSGTEEIYVGLRTYENANADYYNLTAAGFIGYVPSNAFAAQPGAVFSGVPAHNLRIDYWLTLNGQRLVLAMKVGTPVYESMYLGKMLPYARPSQYPYPMVVGGMLSGEASTRFSDTSHTCWVKGGSGRSGASGTFPNMRLRFNDAIWHTPNAFPWNNLFYSGSSGYAPRDTEGVYALTPVVLNEELTGLLGELDGVFHISGFNNGVENTLTIDGVNYVVMQDVWRTGHGDYYAICMED
ncbi:hypothetical protein [Comamonas sp.]|uniref:hypothetical protein n=1 Tax=Comamonas sp. TaxID=34028 RepID=UPI00258F33D7|nr:hypothetical protein [Comamonas sp.]